MSQIYKFSAGGGGVPIITIDGDIGSISGSTVTIYADVAAKNSGSTVEFVNSGTISTLNLTDSSNNTMLGTSTGNVGVENTALGAQVMGGVTGESNVGIGFQSLEELEAGSRNTAIGFQTLLTLESGTDNIAIGWGAGGSHVGSDSSNIDIGNFGVFEQSNAIHIGTQGTGNGEQNVCFIAGIVGNTVSNQQFVTINSATGQLGVTTQLGTNVTIVTAASYQVLVSDDFIGINHSGAQTTTLEATPSTGREITIKDISGLAASNNITINGNGNNIDGFATYVIDSNYGSVTLVFNGSTGWSVI